MKKIEIWLRSNIVCVILSIIFIIIYVIKYFYPYTNNILGVCDLHHLNNEYYRLFTNSLLHYSLYHLCGNIIGLLSVSSLLSRKIGQIKTLFLFFIPDALSSFAFSWLVSSYEPSYSGGASGGIFSLIATLMVCYLRFPDTFKFKPLRFNLFVLIVYFFVANNNWCAFLSHCLSISIGTIIAFVLVMLNILKPKQLDIKLNDLSTISN